MSLASTFAALVNDLKDRVKSHIGEIETKEELAKWESFLACRVKERLKNRAKESWCITEEEKMASKGIMEEGKVDESSVHHLKVGMKKIRKKRKARVVGSKKAGASVQTDELVYQEVLMSDAKIQTDDSSGSWVLEGDKGWQAWEEERKHGPRIGAEDDDHFISCNICFESFSPTRVPQSSTCGHLIDDLCLGKLFESASGRDAPTLQGRPLKFVRCPVCRAKLFRHDFIRLNLPEFQVDVSYKKALRQLIDGIEMTKNRSMLEIQKCLKQMEEDEKSKMTGVPTVVDQAMLKSMIPKVVSNAQAASRLARVDFLQKQVSSAILGFERILIKLETHDIPPAKRFQPPKPGQAGPRLDPTTTNRWAYSNSGTRAYLQAYSHRYPYDNPDATPPVSGPVPEHATVDRATVDPTRYPYGLSGLF